MVDTLWQEIGYQPSIKNGKLVRPKAKISPDQVVYSPSTPPSVEADPVGQSSNTPVVGESQDSVIDVLSRDASNRTLTISDLSGLSTGDLRLLRNALYARHGYIFKSEDLQSYFGAKAWYSPSNTDMQAVYRAFSGSEIASLEAIRAAEAR